MKNRLDTILAMAVALGCLAGNVSAGNIVVNNASSTLSLDL